MKRYGQILKLRPEHRDDYVRHHAEVWPAVLEQIRRSNIRNYSIYLRDGILFAYFEYVGVDFEADMRAMAADRRRNAGGRSWSPCRSSGLPLRRRSGGRT